VLINDERRPGDPSKTPGDAVHETPEGLTELLRERLPFLDSGETLSADSNLTDYGLDSFGVVDLLAALEKKYDVRFRNELLTMDNFATPGTIAAVLSSLLNQMA
jgi:acyl carrier protein